MTLSSGNPLHFRKYLLEGIYYIIMIIDDQIKDGKLQHNINRDAAKISTLSSGKINIIRILPHAKFIYSQLGKTFEQ